MRMFSAALNISRHPSVGGESTIQQGGSCLATHVPPAPSHTAALGGSVAVLDGLGAGDYRRVAAWEVRRFRLRIVADSREFWPIPANF